MGAGKARVEAISIEGLAMVHALVIDAVEGQFEVHAMLQEDIATLPRLPPATDVHWHRIRSGIDVQDAIKEIAPSMDYSFVVAPEFGGYLDRYTCTIESLGCTVLSQPSSAVIAASDKAGALGRLSRNHVCVPTTQTISEFAAYPATRYPVVVKPNHGAGSVGVFLARDATDLDAAVAADEQLSFPREELIVQEFITGIPLSASVIATPYGVDLLGINEQDVILSSAKDSGSKYRGGVAGALHPELAVAIERIARAAANEFQLRGYFGFDFILDPRGVPVVVEVNPRLTTSFAGLKLLHRGSMLRFMADMLASKKVERPWRPDSGFVAYQVIELPGSREISLGSLHPPATQDIITISSPGGGISAFVAAKGTSKTQAIDNMNQLAASL